MLLYNSFYLSNLSYGIEVWSNTYKSNITKLIMLQKKVIRIINLLRKNNINNAFILKKTLIYLFISKY